jgi:hypothetical protein
MTHPVRSSQATMKPVTKQAKASIPVMGRSVGAARPVLRQQLNPGDIIIFEDALFKHGATPLVNPDGGATKRDALICTVDYRSTYLETAS